MHYENKNFENQTVQLDGNTFKYCMFKNCILEYGGGDHIGLDECTFISPKLKLSGAAERTYKFFRWMWNNGEVGKSFVEDFIAQVRRPI